MRRRYESAEWATVIAIDPGGTTGWSVMCVYTDALSDADVSILKSIAHRAHGQVGGDEDEQARILIELIAAWPGCAVVVEDFVLRKYLKGRELLSPVRITAKVEYAVKRGLEDVQTEPRLWIQSSSLAKSTATDDRLRQWGLYQREGGLEHARDADRHAITFLRRASERTSIRAKAWPHIYAEDGGLMTESDEAG